MAGYLKEIRQKWMLVGIRGYGIFGAFILKTLSCLYLGGYYRLTGLMQWHAGSAFTFRPQNVVSENII